MPNEEAGKGCNTSTYFVSSYLGGPLTQLPYVAPAQIKAARTLNKFLTGKLTSTVSTYPVFPGNEANYLRAQVCEGAAGSCVPCAPHVCPFRWRRSRTPRSLCDISYI